MTTTVPESSRDERTSQAGWNFDGFGPEFDSHVVAHLPAYETVQGVVGAVSSFTLPDLGVVADLGASTGRTVMALHEQHPHRRITAHLYDTDPSMLEVARQRISGGPAQDVVTAHCHVGDLTSAQAWRHTEADLTLALWLLQFLHPAQRVQVLARARERAAGHGAILVAAKMRHTDPRWQEVADAALVDHKAAAGVTPEEITAKAASLRGVMIPDTVGQVRAQLDAAGWHGATVVYSWHVWTLIGAWASPIG
jgi:tRNA (cmo5U34)-methyltransferase